MNDPRVVNHVLFAEHDQRCPVLYGEKAVYNCNTAIFGPSWKAQSQGWKLIHANTPFKRFLLRFF